MIHKTLGTLTVALATLTLGATAHAQSFEEALSSLDWVEGPQSVSITDRATLALPEGYVYLAAQDTARFMELLENIPGPDEYTIAPDDLSWFAVFSYEETGHVSDNEEIDAKALLADLMEANRAASKERQRRGWGTLELIGWQQAPFYEPDTRRLSWATLIESADGRIVNYNTRLLGRTGVMSVTLVAEPDELEEYLPQFKSALQGFGYESGQRYAEFRAGDKVAAFGLAGLIAGGAAAAASKGAGKGLFKAIGLAVVAGFAVIGKFFKRLFRRA